MEKRIAPLVYSLLIIGLLVLPMGSGAPQNAQANSGKPFLSGKPAAEIELTISKMSGHVMLELAKAHGIRTIAGKDVTSALGVGQGNGGEVSTLTIYSGTDVPVSNDPKISEDEPSIAARPDDASKLVASSHYIPQAPCAAYTSSDGGSSWSGPIFLPLRFSTDFCSDSITRVLGNTFYAAYLSIRNDQSSSDLVVVKSTDNGATWTGLTLAIAGSSTIFIDKPWLDVQSDGTNAYVYVTATRFYSNNDCEIVFARSDDGGSSFGASTALSAKSSGCKEVVQGSRPVGDSTGKVLVCWYDSGTDGWLKGGFKIDCKNSTDFGVSFGNQFTAVSNSLGELPYWLCPSSAFYRWWGGMFPSMVIDDNGIAHIVFAKLGPSNGDCGDVYYAKSNSVDYALDGWTSPIDLINGDANGMAQGYPTIAAKGTTLFVAWDDHRNSVGISCRIPGGIVTKNCKYDVFYVSGSALSSSLTNNRISDASSLSDYTFIGDYFDSTTNTNNGADQAYVAWTDRRDKTRVTNGEDDVYSNVAIAL